jgi:hypothetical protein
MMKRKFFSTIAAVAALSFVTGLLGCSDDDDAPSFCEEAKSAANACLSTVPGAEDALKACEAQPTTEAQKTCQKSVYSLIYGCLYDKMCGDIDIDKDEDKYDECVDEVDDCGE